MVEEERGTQSGCILSPLATWDEVAELTDADYTGEIYETFDILPLDTLTKGARGELVRYLQVALVDAGYDIGKGKDGKPLIDGIFGGEVLSAVRAFQHDHGLTADGKVGQKTWTAIKGLVQDDEPEGEEPEDAPEDAPALTVEERLERLEKAVFGQEGGSTNGS